MTIYISSNSLGKNDAVMKNEPFGEKFGSIAPYRKFFLRMIVCRYNNEMMMIMNDI